MMSLPPPSNHFQGKSVVEHLREARSKGAIVSNEVHGTELSGCVAAGADAAKETAIALSIFGGILLFSRMAIPTLEICLFAFLLGWLAWKTGRSAILGWTRLERLHRLIEEERYEIEHNRAQEKEELKELYEAKGFSGKLLDQVVDVLIADDNRLLKVMLEEELGLSLESYEHPLKQAAGASLGVVISAVLVFIGWHFFAAAGLMIGAFASLIGATILTAKIERNHLLQTMLWTLATALLAGGLTYFAFALLT